MTTDQEIRSWMIEVGNRVREACADAEGFGTYANSDWSVNVGAIVEQAWLDWRAARSAADRPASLVSHEEPAAVSLVEEPKP